MEQKNIIALRKNKTIYRDGDKCIKLFCKGYSKSDILNEALNQARIEETELNIPKILEVTTIDGCWAIVLEYIKGKTLAELIEENPEKKNEYLAYMVDLQLQVASQKVPLINRLKDKMQRKINQAEIADTTRYDLQTRLESMPKEYKLCHGDFNPSNIIISEDGKPYIIDWSHVTQGNMCADGARTYLLFRLNGDEEGAETYLELFCKKSKITKKNIQKWLPVVAASQSVKGNKEERDFLLSWVDVVDYY